MSINIKKDGKLVKIAPTSYNELTDLPNIESSGDVTYITDESGKNVATIGPGGLSTTGIVVDRITLDGEDVGTKLDSIKGEIDFNDLTNNPISDNNDGTVSFADENGNKIVLIDSEGVTSVEFKADKHKLTEKANQSYVQDQITRLEASAFSGDYNDLENAPIINDTTGSAVFADDQGNQIAKIDAEGVTSVEFIAGTHKLTNKAEKDALLADFTEDSEHQTVTSAEKTYWSNKSEFSGKFKDLTDSPIIDDNSGELIYTDGTNTIVKIDASGITTTNVAIKEGDVATLIGEKADQTSLDATNNTITATNVTVSTHTIEISNLKTEVTDDKTALETFKTETASNFTAVNKRISDTNDVVDVLENKVSINEEKLEGVQASDGEFTITDGTNIGMKLDSEGLLHVREVEVAGGRVDERLKDIENYFSTEEDADSNLNKWHEIVNFLNGFEETDQVLENIIATKASNDTVNALDAAYKAADKTIGQRIDNVVTDYEAADAAITTAYTTADSKLQADINTRALQSSLDATNQEVNNIKEDYVTKVALAREVETQSLITDAITLNEDEFIFADDEGYKIAEINSTGITSVEFVAGEHQLTKKADKTYVDAQFSSTNASLESMASTIRNEFAEEDLKLSNKISEVETAYKAADVDLQKDIATRALQTSLDATNQKVSTIESTYATKAEVAKKVETELLVADDITLNKSEFVFSDVDGNKIAQIDSAGINSTEFVSGDHKLTLKADKTYVDQLNINVGETISNTASAIRNEFKAADTALQEGINKRALQTALDSTNQEVSNIKNNYVTKAEIAAEVKTEHLEADNITLNQDSYVFTDGTNKIAEIDSTGVSSTEFTAGSHQLTKKADISYVDDQVASVNSTITTTAAAIRKEFADADSELSGKIDKKADQTAVDATNSRIDTIANTYATKEEIATEVDTDHLVTDRVTLNDDTFIFADNKGDGHKIAEINSEGVTSVDFIAGNKGEHKLTLKADASYVNDQITALDAKDVELSGKITTVETNYKSADENIKLAYAAADKTVEDKITALENSIGTSISTGNITATGTIKANKIITDDFELKQDSYQFADSNGNKIAEISSNGLSTTKVQIAEGNVATLINNKVSISTFNETIESVNKTASDMQDLIDGLDGKISTNILTNYNNATVTNPTIKLDKNTTNGGVQFKGSGVVTVSSNAKGEVTIHSDGVTVDNLDMSAYLTREDATGTYLAKEEASNTYAPKSLSTTVTNYINSRSSDTVSLNGETLTVTINGTTKSLTNTNDWRPISNKINGTSETTSASEKAVASAYSLANGKYSKPSTGIPETDLDSDVQASLGKADTALQPSSLRSSSNASYGSTVTSTADRQYAVVKDKDGYLSVNVPWEKVTLDAGSLPGLEDALGDYITKAEIDNYIPVLGGGNAATADATIIGGVTVSNHTVNVAKKTIKGSGIATVTGDASNITINVPAPSIGDGTVTIKQNGTSKGSFTLNQSGNVTIDLTDSTYSATDANPTLTWGSKSKVATVCGTDIHVTMPDDPNTHYISKNVVGTSSTATVNGAVTGTGGVYLNHLEESAVKSTHKIVGAGTVNVTSDSNGNITITGTNTNTDISCTEEGHYDPKTEDTANKQSAGSRKYISGIKLDSKKHVVGIDTGTLPSFTESYKGTVTRVTPGIGLKLNGKSDGDSTAITSSGTIDLQVASSSELGGIKIGYTESGKNYPVKLDSNNKAYVYVPWTDTNTDTWRGITDSVSTTSSAISASATAVKKAYDLAASKGSGTVTSITPGTGLTNGTGETAITSSGTLNLKVASADEIGGIRIGYSESGKNYAVKLDSNNKAYVNVPWTDTNTDTDENVAQTVSTSNYNYPILTRSTNGTTTGTGGTSFSAYVTLNPSTRLLQVGSSSSSSYYGKVQAGSGFFQTSDERLKNFGEDVKINFEVLKSIPKKYFTWKDDETNKLNIGTSAQEIQKIYPEVVSETDGILTVDYNKLSIVALKAVDELYDKNKELEARIERLEKLLIKE